MITRVQAVQNLQEYIGTDLLERANYFGIVPFKNGKQNKGWKGLVLEKLAGLENDNVSAPNGLGFELKSVSFHYDKKGVLKPKETMAITMINADDLINTDFYNSHLWAKLKSLVFCAVLWTHHNQENAILHSVTSFDFLENDSLIEEIKNDYDFIRQKCIEDGFHGLSGRYGKWIQPRTKGQGGINPRTGERNPITRAFYARKNLISIIFGI